MNNNILTKRSIRLFAVFVVFCIILIFIMVFVKSKHTTIYIFISIVTLFIMYNFFILVFIKRLKKIIQLQRQKSFDTYKTMQNINLDLIKEKNIPNDGSDETISHLKKANEMKTNFFINFAHETKTILTLIGNYFIKLNNLLKSKTDDEQVFQYLDIILKNYENIQNDIINFLDIEKFEKGKITYDHNQIVKLKPFLERKIELFKENALMKKIKISHSIDNAYIKIDPFALDRIINNLMDNAIKYNKENGKINVIVKTANGKIFLLVKDTGIGMNKKQIEAVFEPYQYQNILQGKKSDQGLGIGLSIVNHIVKQTGGKIKIESKDNCGLDFTIMFPEAKKGKNAIKENAIEGIKPNKHYYSHFLPEKHLKGLPVILIVDDDIDMLKYLQNELYDIFNVYYASNGREALEKIEKIPKPDLIISDIIMNEINGYELKNLLYEKNKYKAIPFIFLTAKSTDKEKIQGLVKGAISYITKPFKISELFVTISSIVDFTKIQKKINNAEFHKKLSVFLNQSKNKNPGWKKEFEYICYKNHISNTEKEIVKLILQGKEYKQIANELSKSFNTIRNQSQSVMKKLKIKNKKDLNKIFNFNK